MTTPVEKESPEALDPRVVVLHSRGGEIVRLESESRADAIRKIDRMVVRIDAQRAEAERRKRRRDMWLHPWRFFTHQK